MYKLFGFLHDNIEGLPFRSTVYTVLQDYQVSLREKKNTKSTEHFWPTICSDTSYPRKYERSVPVFCAILYRVLWKLQRICTDSLHSLRTPFSVHFLFILCAKARIFFSVITGYYQTLATLIYTYFEEIF